MFGLGNKIVDVVKDGVGIAGKAVEDKDQLNQLQADLTKSAMQTNIAIRNAHLKSTSWLARNCFPIALLAFVYIVFQEYCIEPILNSLGIAFDSKDIPPQMWDFIFYGFMGSGAGTMITTSILPALLKKVK